MWIHFPVVIKLALNQHITKCGFKMILLCFCIIGISLVPTVARVPQPFLLCAVAVKLLLYYFAQSYHYIVLLV